MIARIGVIGAGAMGSLFASHLAGVEAEIWAYDVWREHVDAIRRHGLAVRRNGVERTVRLRATADPNEVGPCDVVMVFVKFGQTHVALQTARPMIEPNSIIVTLQNGIGNVDIIASLFPRNRIVFGLTTLTSELLGPGRIEASYAGRGETYLWPRTGKVTPTIEDFCALLVKCGIAASLQADVELKIWKKLVVNCCLNPLCAITDQRVGGVADVPETWPFLDGVADEIVAVAQRNNIPLIQSEAHAFLRQVADEARNHEPSMLVDVRHGRATEIECLNGAVLRECDRHGIAAPYNRALYTIIRVLEQMAEARHR